MNTEFQRRTVLIGVGTALTGAVAGCGGDDGSAATDGGPAATDGGPAATDGDGAASPVGENATQTPGDGGPTATDAPTADQSDPTPTATATPASTLPTEKESIGTVATNAIDELTLVGWRSEAPTSEMFDVVMAVRNDGSEPTSVRSYTWNVVPYDENGERVPVSAAGPLVREFDGDLAAGDTGVVSYSVRVEDASAIASYEIHVSCQGTYADGKYCPE